MKASKFVCLLIATLSCSLPNDELSKAPQTVFEGVWLWLKTEGIGFAGPYVKDSISEGHSIRYDFINGSDLQVYFDKKKQLLYKYSFTLPEEDQNGNPKLGELTLENLVSGRPSPERYYWEIEKEGNQVFLYLTNFEPCCDNSFKEYYVLIERHIATENDDKGPWTPDKPD